MLGLGFPEIIVILIIVVFIFGAGRLPEIMGSLGKGIHNFKKAIREPDKGSASPLTNDSEDKRKAGKR
ncbi:MAG TPA: twin-arginine translocase TatA/TatE family subunit [Syntrophorhabdaceae bacterium]|nr:twin-arginine translocase TatA/TatE family subunit [Syntrophorhabdaceae bacterium]